MSGKTYFITGANRGIGYQLATKLWSPENTVIASARNPEAATALNEFAKTHSNFNIVKLDVSSEDSIAELDAQLAKVAPEGIDVFVSNAGISQDASVPVLKAPASVWYNHYKTNTVGSILTTQVVYPYLAKKDTKKIFFTSSALSLLTNFLPLSTSAYGQSKTALNHSVVTLAFELKEEGFTVIPFHPGLVLTDMTDGIFDRFDKESDEYKYLKATAITPEQSGDFLVALFEKVNKEDSGKFYNYDGTVLPF